MRKDTEKREVPFIPTSDHENNVGFVDFEYIKIICPDLIEGISESIANSKRTTSELEFNKSHANSGEK